MQNTELEQLLIKWNPHFQSGKARWEDITPRSYYLDKLWEALPLRHIMVLTGVRRSGKSTLMHQMIGKLIGEGTKPTNIVYLQLEDSLVDKYLLEHESQGKDRSIVGAGLLEKLFAIYREKHNPQGKIYLFLDEIQGIKGFNRVLNGWYESQENLKCIVSGSRKSLIDSEMATLLTGRTLQFTIYPFNFREYLMAKGVQLLPPVPIEETRDAYYEQTHTILHHLGNYLHEGAFPEVVMTNSEANKSLIATSYYKDFLARDIIGPNQIRNSRDAEVLGLQILADFTKTHTYRSLAKPLKLTSPTVKSYLEYFYQAYLFYESTFFSYSTKETQDIQRERKIYVVDNGLRNFNALFKTEDLGRCAENLVYLELSQRNSAVFYWKGKQEVDFVVKDPGVKLYNCTYTDDIPEREMSGLAEGMMEFKLSKSVLLTKNTLEDRQVEDKQISLIPLWAWLLADTSGGVGAE